MPGRFLADEAERMGESETDRVEEGRPERRGEGGGGSEYEETKKGRGRAHRDEGAERREMRALRALPSV